VSPYCDGSYASVILIRRSVEALRSGNVFFHRFQVAVVAGLKKGRTSPVPQGWFEQRA